MTKEKESGGGTPVPKTKLLVTVSYDPNKIDYKTYVLASIIEYYGCWLEHKRTKTKHSMIALFDNIKNGAEYFDIFKQFVGMTVIKEEVVE